MSAPARVDVLVACTASTPGNASSERELVAALWELGISAAVAATDYGWIGRLPMSQNLIDLTRSASMSWAVSRALRRTRPRAIIYGTASAAHLEPAARLRMAGVRFDSLAAENRPGLRHALQRALERRMLSHAALLLPWSSRAVTPPAARTGGRAPITLPTPIGPPVPPSPSREPIVVCYAAAPDKKRLGTMLEVWRLAGLPEPHRLVVCGLDADRANAWLSRRRITAPQRVSWAGQLRPAEYRALTARAELYLAASRYEDYGIAQLEALADGALLVTTPSPGPYEALGLARRLEPRLVAADMSPEALAAALRAAHGLPAAARERYRRRAAELLESYSREAFRQRLADEVLPALFAAVEAAPT